MSVVHKALEALHPRDWAEIPTGDALPAFLKETFSLAETIIASVPQPTEGLPSSISHVNAARTAKEIHCSSARLPDPQIEDLATLRKGWGKPIKLAAKDNVLGMTVWKMAGNDRHGAWFARRSVHEGLSFTKWKSAMQKEFAKSLAVQGTPGEGSVRGIGADKHLEKEAVEGLGNLDVYQLSAQFPGPVAPREFITCLLTSESALSETSATPASSVPRHYMVVSIPVDHPEAPQQNNTVRGNYESVEMIREIPLNQPKSQSTPNLLKKNGAPARSDSVSETVDLRGSKDDDSGMNPVEWIMVTRSDPGGGIPRFMVERNTPASIAGDAVKFLDWATGLDDMSEDETVPSTVGAKSETSEPVAKSTTHEKKPDFIPADSNGHLAGLKSPQLGPNQSLTGAYEPSGAHDSGIIASRTSAASAYVPNMVKDRLYGTGETQSTEQFPEYDEDSDSSDTSYDSAQENMADWATAYEGPDDRHDILDSTSNLSLGAVDSAVDSAQDEEFKNTNDHKHFEKEIQKIAARRKTLDEKTERERQEREKREQELLSREEKDVEKQKDRLEKEKIKQEERYRKEMEKLNAKQKKEEERVELKRKKNRDKDANARDRRERDEYKRRVELLQRENELLRRQMGDLQRENTVLVQKVGKLEKGKEVVMEVREELSKTQGATPRNSSEVWGRAGGGGGERERASSVHSARSKKSGETGKSKLSGVS